MQDVHTGFQDLDHVTQTEEFFDFLDAADALESVQSYRQSMLELCPVEPGQRLLDVGCGIGHSTLKLASLVGATGAVVGLDKSETFIDEARRRAATVAAPVAYQVADARHLGIASQSVDLCRAERVLMYVNHPEQALDEMFRVLRPSGMVALFEFDYEGIVVDAPDRALTRRVIRFVSDSVPSPWIGRQLPRLLRERGVCQLAVIPHMILSPYAMFSRVIRGTSAQAVQHGQIASTELDAWWHALERAEATGRFFAGFPGVLLCGRTPPESA